MSTTTTMSCADAAQIMRAYVAQFTGEIKEYTQAQIEEADRVSTAHYHGWGNCAPCLAEQV